MKKKKRKLYKILILLLILLITVLLCLLFTRNKNVIDYVKEDLPVYMKLEENQTDEKQIKINKIYSPDITLPGWGELTISANTKDIGSQINIYNPESNVYYNCPKCLRLLENLYCPYCQKEYEFKEVNQNVYYLKFTIILKDNNEVIYETNLIKPGYHINNIVFNRELEVGDYEASILIEPYKTDMATKCNCGEVEVLIHATDTF